ncbi:MAG: PIN domain-containing protein, partial [Burkholderiales bacterium]
MPLPKAPNKPATLLSITDSPLKPSAPVAKAKLQVIAAPPEPAQARVKAPAPAAPPPARATKTVPVPASVPVTKTTRRKREDDGVKKLFVLDTNVLMHDPSSLFRFEEHDVYLPIMTLEELDNHKKGMSEVSRNARQVSRTMDALLESAGQHHVIEEGLSLSSLGNKDATGRLYFQTQVLPNLLPSGLPTGKADNQILSVVRALQESRSDRRIVLVSKDINMRIKARALGLPAEDYFNDHVLEDTDLLYAGWLALPPDFWSKHGKGVESWQQQGSTFYRITGPVVPYL